MNNPTFNFYHRQRNMNMKLQNQWHNNLLKERYSPFPMWCYWYTHSSLLWRHNGRGSVSNHQPTIVYSTGDRWIPHTNGQERGKCFHLMTSSCSWLFHWHQSFPPEPVKQDGGMWVKRCNIIIEKEIIFNVIWKRAYLKLQPQSYGPII